MATGVATGSSLIIYNLRGEEIRRIPVDVDRGVTITGEDFPAGIYYGMLVRKDQSLIAAGPIVVE
jgi:hypothetical protein